MTPSSATRFSSFTMVLSTYNEAARVRRVIEYYRPFAPLLVIDNLSRDGTPDLVRSLGVEVVSYANPGTIQTPEWFRHVASLVRTEHFVLLACSEFLPAPLLERFDEVARAASADVVSCVRHSYTCGERMAELWGDAPRVERFFSKSGLDFDAIMIHAPFAPQRPDRLLALPPEERYTITHLRDVDAASLLKKGTEYGAVEAGHRLARGKPPTLRWLLKRLRKELGRLLRVRRSRPAAREVWARMVMHSVIYWVAWELEEKKGIAYSRAQSDDLWRSLVARQAGGPTP